MCKTKGESYTNLGGEYYLTERSKIKSKRKWLLITLVIVLIPATALALQSNRDEPKTKSPEQIQKIIENKIELSPFPIGEFPKKETIPTPVVKTPYRAPVQVTAVSGTCVDWIRQAGITDIKSALLLINRESGCRVNAYNPSGAYGIPQSLPGSKMASAGADWRTNPITQLRWMNTYCLSRYGSWAKAYNFQISHGWY